jgi:DNA-binding NarL/FixJ family response regulator
MNKQPQPLTVLIADDSQVIRVRLARLLEEIPGVAIVGQSATGKETVEMIRRLAPHVVVLDLSMPEGSGLEVMQQMRDENLEAIVIVLTNYPYPEYEQRALRLGARTFLSKSSEFENLADIIRDLAGKSKQAPTVEEEER